MLAFSVRLAKDGTVIQSSDVKSGFFSNPDIRRRITSGYPFFLVLSHGTDPATGAGRRRRVPCKMATVTAAAVRSAPG